MVDGYARRTTDADEGAVAEPCDSAGCAMLISDTGSGRQRGTLGRGVVAVAEMVDSEQLALAASVQPLSTRIAAPLLVPRWLCLNSPVVARD
jgi:hypothetical protein